MSFKLIACGCNSMGSTSPNCDVDGICDCKTEVIGDKCTTCKPGYTGFPSCSKPHYKCKQQSPLIILNNFFIKFGFLDP